MYILRKVGAHGFYWGDDEWGEPVTVQSVAEARRFKTQEYATRFAKEIERADGYLFVPEPLKEWT